MSSFSNHKYYNCSILLDNGEQFNVNANWLHNENLDNWKNWSCDAGYNRINIDVDFSVTSGECHNDYLGNLLTEWHLLDNLTTCRKDRCTGCTDDLLIFKKEKRNVN